MKTNKSTIFTLLYFLFFIFSMNSAMAQDPSQYGIPFAGVPDARDVTIYQVNTRAFSSTHNFQGVINRLDSIKALGVNVIYIMPIYPVGTLNAVNSPYCIKNLDSVGTEFGTLTDLRNLVDGAHSRNMAIILDFVVNQTSWDHPWITAHPDWYIHNTNGTISQLGNYADVAALNFADTSMCTAMINAMRGWVFRANFDGFRCDFADNPPNSFWQKAIASLRSIKTHKLLMLAEGSRSTNYTSGFDYNFGFTFYGQIKSIYSSNQSVQLINNLNSSDYTDADSLQQIVRYLTNHDVNGSDGAPVTLFGGITGSMAAFIPVAYMKSVPFVYNGQEVAFPTPITFPFTTVTVNWTLNPAVTAEYKKVIGFRNSSNAIRRGKLTSYSSPDVCGFFKNYGTDSVLVISNLRNSTINFTLPTVVNITIWNDAFTGAPVLLDSILTLSPYQYKVLTNQYHASCLADTLTWTGSISTAWENASNWSCGMIPNNTSHVVLNSNAVVVLNSTASIETLTLNKGASLTINPNFHLEIQKQ